MDQRHEPDPSLEDEDDGPPTPTLEELERQLDESERDIAAGRLVTLAEVREYARTLIESRAQRIKSVS